ncbi:MAG TPA: adenylate/guanylate cyclase domain-containing protein [Dehalococcoidia bacterium]
MDPRIQYAQTADGVSIAFWTMGEGPPLVQMPAPISHVQLELQMPDNRLWYERLAGKRTLVRYDGRGFGLSDREIGNYTLEAQLLDLQAVVERIGLEQFAVIGPLHQGPAAIAYAARHPDRVTHLILWCTSARGSDLTAPSLQAAAAGAAVDWETFTETLSNVVFGWSVGEPARQYAAMIREAVTAETLAATGGIVAGLDVTSLLPSVSAPTLVLHRQEAVYPSLDAARRLVAQIPDARLALLEGGGLAPYLGDMEAVVGAINEFFGESQPATAASPGQVHSVLFTDVVGHSEMMARLGDQRGRDVLREHERITREVLALHGGTEVKTMGDGFMASFGSVSRAVECAIALQRAFDERESEEPLLVRVGINAGEPIEEEGDLFGATVILASRIAAKAGGGEILVADTIRGLCSGKGFLFADRGEFVAKGFEDPVSVYEVSWRSDND